MNESMNSIWKGTARFLFLHTFSLERERERDNPIRDKWKKQGIYYRYVVNTDQGEERCRNGGL